MKRYKCVRDCYFNRLYRKGQIIQFGDGVKVPRHFQEIKPPKQTAGARKPRAKKAGGKNATEVMEMAGPGGASPEMLRSDEEVKAIRRRKE